MAVNINEINPISTEVGRIAKFSKSNFSKIRSQASTDDAVVIEIASNSQLGNLPKVQASTLIKLNLFDANQDGEVTPADTIHRNQAIAQHSAQTGIKTVRTGSEKVKVSETPVSIKA